MRSLTTLSINYTKKDLFISHHVSILCNVYNEFKNLRTLKISLFDNFEIYLVESMIEKIKQN